jgi:hypothetical protein
MAIFKEFSMNVTRHIRAAAVDRRVFCRSIFGLGGSLLFGGLAFWMPKISSADHDFVIVNGWVLTRKDVASSKPTSDAL